MTLEVDFQTPGQEGTHHMSMPIGGWTFLKLDSSEFQVFLRERVHSTSASTKSTFFFGHILTFFRANLYRYLIPIVV